MDTLATYKQALTGKSEEQVLAEFKHPFLVRVPREVVASKLAARTAYQERASLGVSRSTFRPDPKCEVFKVVRKETGAFIAGDRVFVGRGEDCDLPIAASTISKHHAYLLAGPAAGTANLVEMTSTNGTFLNGKRLAPREQKPLTDGDMVSLGPDTHFAFFTPKGLFQACQETKAPPAGPPARLMDVDPVV
ncbi:MAG: FHA domain-containing protein [Nitrospirae bacterium]|nr:FHA domain-containing protein [Nitrospirota bacterium]